MQKRITTQSTTIHYHIVGGLYLLYRLQKEGFSSISLQFLGHYWQAQPKPQLQLSWADIALILQLS